MGMLPPAEQVASISQPPPSSRGPMVIRVDVPSFSPATASISPRPESSLPSSDGQLSALARLAANNPSVMPEVAGPAVIKTPVSMLPSSDGPEIHVGVLSMPHLRAEPVAAPADPIPTPAPVLIPESPPPQMAAASEPPQMAAVSEPPQMAVVSEPPSSSSVPASDVAHPDEGSGVRHVLLKNERGVLREVCTSVVSNRCS